ncbi:phage head-tail connector protein [Paenibacillus agricola]|uniref:Phage head-tail connector protein n=1 Tax=Paenibacillus agricola TaxID=2716264 RepID=A0ABX0JIA7_9BACL|nr:phage head-tail connector protein [Paenibacillus agricola]NHN34707.1 phage head-tail connector protein [Paenibacillus agricola]
MSATLDLFKQLIGVDVTDTSKDDILNHYLKKARSNIIGYCNIESLPIDYDEVIVDYAVYLFKNKDSVGLMQKQEGERSASYEPGIPQSIRLALPLPRIKVGN